MLLREIRDLLARAFAARPINGADRIRQELRRDVSARPARCFRARRTCATEPPDESAIFFTRCGARPARRRNSGIVEVFNYGRGREGLIPLWAGEGDLPTPEFIAEATSRSLAAGETFYT